MSLTIRLALAAVAAGLLVSACGTAGEPTPTPSASPAASPSSPAAPSPSATSTSPAPVSFGYQPLYPFTGLADAQAWQQAYSSSDRDPWHLSADLTALRFTQKYLGFTDISKVAHRTVANGDAHVTVGLTLPNGTISHAAIIHLVKLGSGPAAPWEVVGTDDTTLTLDRPAYGGTVTSPVKTGGRITGVDESLAVEVRTLSQTGAVGSYCCKPAGGQASPWSITVAFTARTGQVLTIVVHTGGHVAQVERFAVTGVRAG